MFYDSFRRVSVSPDRWATLGRVLAALACLPVLVVAATLALAASLAAGGVAAWWRGLHQPPPARPAYRPSCVEVLS